MKKYWLLFLFIIILVAINTYLISQIEKIRQKPSFNPKINTQPTQATNSEMLILSAVGDISLAREVNYQIQHKENPNFPFIKIAEKIRHADLAIANLESPLIKNCPIIRSGYKFCGQSNNVKGLTFAGFDSLNLANNHSYNYGTEGYQETINVLKQNNLDYFDDQTIDYQTIKNTKIGLLGFDDTASRVNKENLKNKIQQAKQNSDLVIVNFHWGEEYRTVPNQRQIDLAHFAINNGADIIIGHHPHVIQPIKYYQDKPIFYSLGNFVFDQMWSEQTKTGAIGIIEVENGEIVNTQLEKTYMSNCCQPKLLQ